MRVKYRRPIAGNGKSLKRHRRTVLPSIAIIDRRCGRVDPVRPPADLREAQAVRLAAYDARDLTGAILGDPPVGMSALDEKDRHVRGRLQAVEG